MFFIGRNLLFGVYFSPHQKILYVNSTPKETNHEIKSKRYTFSLAFDTDVEKSCF